MGGQAGDTGELESAGQHWRITNTQKSGATWLHFIETADSAASSRPDSALVSSVPGSATVPAAAVGVPSTALPDVGQHVTIRYDQPRRAAIERHHTVTHLLHWALHAVVSRDATQKGSSVGPDKLTFDFNSAALTPAQIAEIERLVNARVRENAPVSWGDFPYADVKGRPEVMQFFGDKYGDVVRVVQIGGHADKDAHGKLHPRLDGYSMELCGGTHVRHTGDIGLFKILHESAIAAGVRRIEAVAGDKAIEAAHSLEQKAKDLSRELGQIAGKPVPMIEMLVSNPTIAEVQALEHRIRELESALTDQKAAIEKARRAEQQKNAAGLADELAAAALAKGALKFIVAVVDAPAGSLRDIATQAGKKIGPGVVVLGCSADGKTGVVALCSPEAIAAGHAAGKIVGDLCAQLGGKGGGKPDFAQGGGKDAAQLAAVLRAFRDRLV
jgi:alanyl-tRNA synthetase